MKINTVCFLLILAAVTFSFMINTVYAVSVEEIRAEIKCPDHDRPEIQSLVEGMIQEGKSKDDILDAVGEKFGEEVFAFTREKKLGVMPFLIPTIGICAALLFVFLYIKKWVLRGEKTTLRDKEIVETSKDINDYNRRFIEEFEMFKKED